MAVKSTSQDVPLSEDNLPLQAVRGADTFTALQYWLHMDDVNSTDTAWAPRFGNSVWNLPAGFLKDADGVYPAAATPGGNAMVLTGGVPTFAVGKYHVLFTTGKGTDPLAHAVTVEWGDVFGTGGVGPFGPVVRGNGLVWDSDGLTDDIYVEGGKNFSPGPFPNSNKPQAHLIYNDFVNTPTPNGHRIFRSLDQSEPTYTGTNAALQDIVPHGDFVPEALGVLEAFDSGDNGQRVIQSCIFSFDNPVPLNVLQAAVLSLSLNPYELPPEFANLT